MAKKGSASMIIETILLIGFVIISMIGVYSFMKGKAETETKKTIEGIASSLECADIKIDFECNESGAMISNIGLFTIKKLLVRDISNNQQYVQDVELTPDADINLPGYISGLEYEVIPLIDNSGKLYMCKEKVKKVKCG